MGGGALYPQLHHRCAASAFILRGLSHRFNMRMRLQGLAQGFAEDTHAAAVDDADTRQAGEKSAVDELFDFAGGVVHVVANDVDL